MKDIKATTCDWCLQEAPVEIMDEKLWRFWKIISTEDPIVVSYKNICQKCKSRYEDFSTYIERCKIHASIIEGILYSRCVKAESSMKIEYQPLFKEEILIEERSDVSRPTSSSKVIIERQVLPGCSNFADNPKKLKEKVPSHRKVKGKLSIDMKVNFTCLHCNKTFNFSSQLKTHLRSHVADKPFKCLLCDKAFSQPGHLKYHMYLHTGEKPFKCSLCNKAFTWSSNLKTHMRLHTGERTFGCPLCNKAFSQSGHLKNHMFLHTGEKPFKCSLCNKTFTRSSTLKNHMRLHTGEQPFKCFLCHKSFTAASTLKHHMCLHTDEKPFKCSCCDKAFTRSSSLKNHTRIHTGNAL